MAYKNRHVNDFPVDDLKHGGGILYDKLNIKNTSVELLLCFLRWWWRNSIKIIFIQKVLNFTLKSFELLKFSTHSQKKLTSLHILIGSNVLSLKCDCRRNALNEVYAHAVLGIHQHVVRYYSAWAEDDYMYIQNEYCNGMWSSLFWCVV